MKSLINFKNTSNLKVKWKSSFKSADTVLRILQKMRFFEVRQFIMIFLEYRAVENVNTYPPPGFHLNFRNGFVTLPYGNNQARAQFLLLVRSGCYKSVVFIVEIFI